MRALRKFVMIMAVVLIYPNLAQGKLVHIIMCSTKWVVILLLITYAKHGFGNHHTFHIYAIVIRVNKPSTFNTYKKSKLDKIKDICETHNT